MLLELGVTNLGVIESSRLDLRSGMTALTGETGAGKTLLVEALQLLLGGKADPSRVRAGQEAATVEALVSSGSGDEMVVRRVVRREGSGRCYIDGHLATVAELSAKMSEHLEIHGQHSQQRLLASAAQRDALDEFAGIDLTEIRELQARIRSIDGRLADVGGDERARLRELDVLGFQLAELDDAQLSGPDEDDLLSAEEDVLVDAVGHRSAAELSVALLRDDEGAHDVISSALAALDGRSPFGAVAERLVGLLAEIDDAANDLRLAAEQIEPDGERLEWIQQRRHRLSTLRRKYGDTLGDVIGAHEQLRQRHDELTNAAERSQQLERERAELDSKLQAALRSVGDLRRRKAPELAAAIEARLHALALGGASMVIDVSDDPSGDVVSFKIAANRGLAAAPLGKGASGGELSRVMLAVRLVLSSGPPTLVFDEVDAGIGGAVATEVGRALNEVAQVHQVLVVTHLAQVAAFAGDHFAVTKLDDGSSTVTTVKALDDDQRVRELSRMLSGMPNSDTGHAHAEELLAAARAAKQNPQTSLL